MISCANSNAKTRAQVAEKYGTVQEAEAPASKSFQEAEALASKIAHDASVAAAPEKKQGARDSQVVHTGAVAAAQTREPLTAAAKSEDEEVEEVESAGARKRREEGEQTKKREDSEFEAALKSKMLKQSAGAAAKAVPRPIRGSKAEQEQQERAKLGTTVSNRLPFRCERCNWAQILKSTHIVNLFVVNILGR